MFRRPEFILPCVALGVAVGSFAWFGFLSIRANRVKPERAKFVVAGPSSPGRDNRARMLKAEPWSPPPAQRRSTQWVYDVFTPPEIFYDARLKAFSVTPPTTAIAREEGATMGDKLQAPPSIQLVGVKRALFRLQLIGFVGTEHGYLGLFENTIASETFLARSGRTVSTLNLVIEEIDVRPRPVALPKSMTTQRLVGTASVRDQISGEAVTLTSTERCYTAEPRATLAIGNTGTAPREVGKGDVIEVNAVTYEIGEIQLSPPSVAICRSASDQVVAERRTLSLQETKVAEPAVPSS
jgi:hypothetical protein